MANGGGCHSGCLGGGFLSLERLVRLDTALAGMYGGGDGLECLLVLLLIPRILRVDAVVIFDHRAEDAAEVGGLDVEFLAEVAGGQNLAGGRGGCFGGCVGHDALLGRLGSRVQGGARAWRSVCLSVCLA